MVSKWCESCHISIGDNEKFMLIKGVFISFGSFLFSRKDFLLTTYFQVEIALLACVQTHSHLNTRHHLWIKSLLTTPATLRVGRSFPNIFMTAISLKLGIIFKIWGFFKWKFSEWRISNKIDGYNFVLELLGIRNIILTRWVELCVTCGFQIFLICS